MCATVCNHGTSLLRRFCCSKVEVEVAHPLATLQQQQLPLLHHTAAATHLPRRQLVACTLLQVAPKHRHTHQLAHQ